MFSAMSGGYVFKMIASPCETVNGPFSIEDRKIWGIYQKYPIVVKRKPRDGSPVVVLIGYLHVINRLGEEKAKITAKNFHILHIMIVMEERMNYIYTKIMNMFR